MTQTARLRLAGLRRTTASSPTQEPKAPDHLFKRSRCFIRTLEHSGLYRGPFRSVDFEFGLEALRDSRQEEAPLSAIVVGPSWKPRRTLQDEAHAQERLEGVEGPLVFLIAWNELCEEWPQYSLNVNRRGRKNWIFGSASMFKTLLISASSSTSGPLSTNGTGRSSSGRA
jgi:hypothetical protein